MTLEDIIPISNLKELKSLSLPANKIVNIEPLREIPNLRYVDLASNGIVDISPVKDVENVVANYQKIYYKAKLPATGENIIEAGILGGSTLILEAVLYYL